MDDESRAGAEVTTVVMTRDRRDSLLATLTHLDGPVVVVDNASSDGTVEAVTRLGRPDVTVVALARNAGATARNVGVRHARTPVVAFADDDSWWAPGALATAAQHFRENPRLAVLAARLLAGDDQHLDPVCEEMAAGLLGTSSDLPGVDVLGFVACGALVRTEAFLACGGFDQVVFFPGEEERLSLDLATAGWGLAYVDDVVAHHHPSPSRGDASGRAALIARNHVLTAVMRRPWRVVVRRGMAAWHEGAPGRQGVRDALPRLAPALRRRRRVPAWVEARVTVLEQRASLARIDLSAASDEPAARLP
ncbi:MAG TPA: glycosyltransferase [Actinomycetales bacterium]|nr:glycosyltransferase [Actinomycetales bacterium]